MKLNKKFLKRYLNSVSPVSHEYEFGGQKEWIKYISEYVDTVEIDTYGSVIAIAGNMNSDYKVIIEAHADEIAWCVRSITSDGYLKVIPYGGSDKMITPSMRVDVFNENGSSSVTGVFGVAAIHIHDRAKDITLDNMFIDIGAKSKSDVLSKGVNIGSMVVYKDGYFKMGNYVGGRALDNRLGGFIIAEVARRLKEKNIQLPYKLYIANCVQEEIGLKGSAMVANSEKFDAAIIVDVCHESSAPCYNALREGEIVGGFGGVIGKAPSIQNNLRKLIIDTAVEHKIPYQLNVYSPSSGTDTDQFAYSSGGCPSALISVPLKYMHTSVELSHEKDIESTIQLFYKTLLNIKENHNFKYNR